MNRNRLIAAHGFLERKEGKVTDLIDVLYAALIVIVIAVAIAGFAVTP
jgi:cell division protein FtsL